VMTRAQALRLKGRRGGVSARAVAANLRSDEAAR